MVMDTLQLPQITLSRQSQNGFSIQASRHRSTLPYCVRDATRTATLAIGAPDAVVTTISHGLVTVVVQTPALHAAELEGGVLFLVARKWAQVNGYRLVDVERVFKDAAA
jgi:hypothetical protein